MHFLSDNKYVAGLRKGASPRELTHHNTMASESSRFKLTRTLVATLLGTVLILSSKVLGLDSKTMQSMVIV